MVSVKRERKLQSPFLARIEFECLGSDRNLRRECRALTVGTTISPGKVTSARGDEVELSLARPVTVFPGSRVAISRKINAWRLIGYGIVEGAGK